MGRDVYINISDFLDNPRSALSTTYADIAGFESSNKTISLQNSGYVTISTRILSYDSALTLRSSPTTTDKSAFVIWASELDEPVNIKVRTK